MTQGRTKIVSLISRGRLKQGLDTDRTSQIRQWFWLPVERQRLDDMALQVLAGIGVSNLLPNFNVLNKI